MTQYLPDTCRDRTVLATLVTIGFAALIAGIYGRFKGLGTWPLGVDEFYISRSIDFVLRSGLPEFPCGGFYNRGLLFQYTVAVVRKLGWSPEMAGRLVAAVSSLTLLPAVFMLGRRIQGNLIGALAVIMLCVSIWEIEMARFARMYAPFQALFTWYLLAYLRYTSGGHARALIYMIGLSVAGVLVWEGGVLLGAANVLAVLWQRGGRLRPGDGLLLPGLMLLLAALYLATKDLRGLADLPVTVDAAAAAAVSQASWSRAAVSWFAPLIGQPLAALALLVPVVPLIAARAWILERRQQGWLLFIGLVSMVVAAFLHAFLLAAAALLLVLLRGLIDIETLLSNRARFFWLTLGACLLVWASLDLIAGQGAAVRQLWGYPDIFDRMIRPWGRSLPFLSVALAAGLGWYAWISLGDGLRVSAAGRALLALIVALVLIVAAINTDRIETRYTFFLYPAMLVIALAAFENLLARVPTSRYSPLIMACTPLLCFAATEDFQPRHLARVDSARTNFRTGMSAVEADHYYPKNDMRSAARWLDDHVRPGDVIVSGIPNLDEYFSRIDYIYLDAVDARYETYMCADGKTDRWTNKPILYTEQALETIVRSGHRIYASVYDPVERQLTLDGQKSGAWTVVPVWRSPYGASDLVLISARSAAGSR